MLLYVEELWYNVGLLTYKDNLIDIVLYENIMNLHIFFYPRVIKLFGFLESHQSLVLIRIKGKGTPIELIDPS